MSKIDEVLKRDGSLTCRKCGLVSDDVSLFARHAGRPQCKKCVNAYLRERRRITPQTRSVKAQVEAKRRYNQRHPEKWKAWRRLKWALETGKITKPDRCQDCGLQGRVEGHHEDYSKPLVVDWLCWRCHRIRDGRMAA